MIIFNLYMEFSMCRININIFINIIIININVNVIFLKCENNVINTKLYIRNKIKKF